MVSDVFYLGLFLNDRSVSVHNLTQNLVCLSLLEVWTTEHWRVCQVRDLSTAGQSARKAHLHNYCPIVKTRPLIQMTGVIRRGSSACLGSGRCQRSQFPQGFKTISEELNYCTVFFMKPGFKGYLYPGCAMIVRHESWPVMSVKSECNMNPAFSIRHTTILCCTVHPKAQWVSYRSVRLTNPRTPAPRHVYKVVLLSCPVEMVDWRRLTACQVCCSESTTDIAK